MRERSHTTPRRRGPKHPLPQDALYNDDSSYEQQESPYYTIDNTEDIYSTTLLPSQRCYIDPWDLENYDYVRKKIGETPSPRGYYDSSASPSPPIEEPIHSPYFYEREPIELAPRMASTMPRKSRSSHYQCQMECCNIKPIRRPSGIYDVGRRDNYDEYMISHMSQKFQNGFNLEDIERNIYRGYGGGSTSSSADPHSSLGDGDYLSSTIPRKSSHHRGPLSPTRQFSKPAPKLEFPAPPLSMPPSYDYCNPYATLPCCSISDCYECLSQAAAQQRQQLQLYGSHSIYGPSITPDSCYDCGPTHSLGRRPSSSLYSGIYSSKFGMSKKGLLQIDYSCSWNDLDRIMTRNY